jgi:hypothetical protein
VSRDEEPVWPPEARGAKLRRARSAGILGMRD